MKAEASIKRIIQLVCNYKQLFQQEEIDYLYEYVAYVDELIANGTLNKQRHKPWSKFNVRRGDDSVFGTYKEVLTLVVWNHNCLKTKLRLRPSEESEQRAGTDLIATNPYWWGEYTVQVKGLYRKDGNIAVYNDFIQYDTKDLDRLILTDHLKQEIYCFNYKTFLNHFKRTTKVYDQYNPDAIYIKNNFYRMKHFDSYVLNP